MEGDRGKLPSIQPFIKKGRQLVQNTMKTANKMLLSAMNHNSEGENWKLKVKIEVEMVMDEGKGVKYFGEIGRNEKIGPFVINKSVGDPKSEAEVNALAQKLLSNKINGNPEDGQMEEEMQEVGGIPEARRGLGGKGKKGPRGGQEIFQPPPAVTRTPTDRVRAPFSFGSGKAAPKKNLFDDNLNLTKNRGLLRTRGNQQRGGMVSNAGRTARRGRGESRRSRRARGGARSGRGRGECSSFLEESESEEEEGYEEEESEEEGEESEEESEDDSTTPQQKKRKRTPRRLMEAPNRV